MEVRKTIRLNILEPTAKKRKEIDRLIGCYRQALWYVIEHAPEDYTKFSLQEKFYEYIREHYGLHSQIANDLFKDAITILNNGGHVNRVNVPFNIPRSGKFATTRRGNPVISIAGLNGRIVIPIAIDGAYRRFMQFIDYGWKTTFFRFDGKHIFTIRRDFEISEKYDAIIGVDIGVDTLATITVLNRNGKVLKQLYFGQDVGHKQRDICLRRSKLQSYARYRKAKKALKRLKGYERNYTTTRCWQIAHQIVDFAELYNAFIAIENLSYLCRANGNGKSNRKTKRMPYAKFRVALKTVAGQNGILVMTVSPKNTSKICSRCGCIGIRKDKFICPQCGYEANSDRNASVNIAIRAGLNFHSNSHFFKAQSPDGNLAVNPGVFTHDGVGLRCLQHHGSLPMQAPSVGEG
ncbi:MAG: transposase [Canidatus Methanoxibalbensis ujae]|nr:transposase [Candidatus Methanoxibalbensis ujae]